jgi:hypothetical protein
VFGTEIVGPACREHDLLPAAEWVALLFSCLPAAGSSSRLQQGDQQRVGKLTDDERLALIISHDLAGADERHRNTDDRAAKGFRLKHVGSFFLGILPGCGKRLVVLGPCRAASASCGRRFAASKRASR